MNILSTQHLKNPSPMLTICIVSHKASLTRYKKIEIPAFALYFIRQTMINPRLQQQKTLESLQTQRN